MQMIAAGLMSGTSLDGIDAALLATDGDKDVRVLAHASHQETLWHRMITMLPQEHVSFCPMRDGGGLWQNLAV